MTDLDSGTGPFREDRVAFRAFLAARVVAIAATLAAIGALDQISGISGGAHLIIGLLLTDLLLTVPYYALGRQGKWHLPRLALLILVAEVLLLTAGEYLLGAESVVYGLPLYGIIVVMAAALHSTRAAFGLAALASSAYGMLVIAICMGWVATRPSLIATPFSQNWPWSTVLVNTMACLALAAVAGSLSETMRVVIGQSRVLESQLRTLNADLEARVESATRTVQSANLALTARNEALQRTSSQVELLARAVSHDLRNPMTAAGELVRLARERGDEEREGLLALAGENLLRADRMLIGLRDLMRATGSEVAEELIDVRLLLNDVISEVCAAQGGRSLPVHLEGEFGVVRARRERLAHVFRNLIVNALEHNRGVPDLEVELYRRDAGDDATFQVRDNGKGIPLEMQKRIFEPFRRGPDCSTDGLGLGLALVHAIVTQAGGRVSVESAPGVGATFRFTLPAAGWLDG